jgi:hypothetical protein
MVKITLLTALLSASIIGCGLESNENSHASYSSEIKPESDERPILSGVTSGKFEGHFLRISSPNGINQLKGRIWIEFDGKSTKIVLGKATGVRHIQADVVIDQIDLISIKSSRSDRSFTFDNELGSGTCETLKKGFSCEFTVQKNGIDYLTTVNSTSGDKIFYTMIAYRGETVQQQTTATLTRTSGSHNATNSNDSVD